MKVLQLGKFYPIRGGVEKVMWDLTRGLGERGIDCDMLCATRRNDGIDAEHMPLFRKEGKTGMLQVNAYARVLMVRAWFKAAATMISPAMIFWLRKHRKEYDIIHIHHPDPMACLALFLSGYKGRVILHWHSDILSQKFFLAFYKPLQSWMIRRAECIIGTTPVYLRESPCLQHVQDKTAVVPIGIEPVRFNPEEAARIRARYAGKKIVFSLGRLIPYKGFSYLATAAKYLGPDYQIVIGGSGPLQENLQAEIEALDLQEHVQLLGYVEDREVPALYGACDIFVLSSIMKTEAFGIVQIEAMSCGKPVVGTEIPESGVSWVNKHGISGLNVPVCNPEALANAIQEICEVPEHYSAFSEGAIDRFRKHFTFDSMIEETIKIYQHEKTY
jgi:rhamnosyl/mannosyltransferase